MARPSCRQVFALVLALLWLVVSLNETRLARSSAWADGDAPHDRANEQPTGAKATHRAEKHQRVGVAALVLPNVRGDKEKALQRVEHYTRRAAALGAKFVVTPETCLDGYCCHQSGLTKDAFLQM